MNTLVALSENDKRLIIALVIIFILLFIIVGYLGLLIKKIMKIQGDKADKMMHDVVVTRVVNTPKHFKRLGYKKNIAVLFKEAKIPMLILIISTLALLIYYLSVGNTSLNIFQYNNGTLNEGGTGFNTLLFLWDFSDPNSYTTVFGFSVLAKWPPLINSPHFSVDAIISYLIVPGYLVGGLWFMVNVQAFMARDFKLLKLSRTIFSQSLENFNASQNTFQNNNQNNNNQ
jgi:hypothetical protein